MAHDSPVIAAAQNMTQLKDKKSAKLEQDFQAASMRFERIMNETNELQKMAEELREMKEKFRRMKQGSDRSKSEYQAFKTDLEDEREVVVTRLKSAQRLVDGYSQQIEHLHQDLREVLMEEVAHEMEQEALRKAQKAKEEREEAQNIYKDAQDRLRMGLTEDMLQAMSAEVWSGNVMTELIRKKEDFTQLVKEAEEAEELSRSELGRMHELRQWLRDFGQPEVARGLKQFVKTNGESPRPKVINSSPIQLTMVLQRLLPRLCRRSKRREAVQYEVTHEWCPGDAEQQRRKEQRERCTVVMERPETWQRNHTVTSLPKSPMETKSPRKTVAEGHKARRISKDHGTARRRNSRTEAKEAKEAKETKASGRKALLEGTASKDAKGLSKGSGAADADDWLTDDPGTFSFFSRWAAAPWSRWEKVEQLPRERWEKTWKNLWADAKKLFEAVPPDAETDEGMPILEGELGIAHFWQERPKRSAMLCGEQLKMQIKCHCRLFPVEQDCHLHLHRLRKVISRNLRGLPHLQRLQDVIDNAQKILGDKRRRSLGLFILVKRKQKTGNNEEEKEERELSLVSDSARKLLEESREAVAQGLQHQQEQMWFCAMLLAQLFGLREALISILGRLRVLSEEHEDLTLSSRVLVHVLLSAEKLTGHFAGETPASVAEVTLDCGQSVTLDARRLQCDHKTLEEDRDSTEIRRSEEMTRDGRLGIETLANGALHFGEPLDEEEGAISGSQDPLGLEVTFPAVEGRSSNALGRKCQAVLEGSREEELLSLGSSETTALLRSRSRGEGLGLTDARAASSTSLADPDEEKPMSPDLEEPETSEDMEMGSRTGL
eukprot:s618_g16.t1